LFNLKYDVKDAAEPTPALIIILIWWQITDYPLRSCDMDVQASGA